MPLSHAARVASDTEFLGLRDAGDAVGAAAESSGDGRYRLVVDSHLVRPDLRLYGGTAVSVSVAAAERATGRDVVWMTTQFVSTAVQGTELDVHVEVLADGYRTNQVRVTGTGPDGVVFASLGAAVRPRPEGMAGVFEIMPDVGPPEDAEAGWGPFTSEAAERMRATQTNGWHNAIEIRTAVVHGHTDPGLGRMCLWLRRRDGHVITPAVAAYMADFVPISISRGLDVMAYGTSLDNSIRIGSFVPTEWMLLDLRPHLASGDYGHGTAHIWSEDGHLLATASQTASLRQMPPGGMPNFDTDDSRS